MTVVTGSLKEFVGQTSASIVLLTFLVLSEYTKRWHTQQQSRGILRSARNCSTVLWRNLLSARLKLLWNVHIIRLVCPSYWGMIDHAT